MKNILIALICLLSFSSCVSSKKHNALKVDYSKQETKAALQKQQYDSLMVLHQQLIQANMILEKEWGFAKEKIQMLTKETNKNSDYILGLKQEMEVLRNEKSAVDFKNEELIKTQGVFAGITKNLLSELEMSQLKVMNLTLALERTDSLNIHLVKKAKKEISEKKYKKALEKLGFVFQ